MKNKNTILTLGLTPKESGGLFLSNIVALPVFFTATIISTAFIPLYLAYFLTNGLHLYMRKASILDDIHSFLSTIRLTKKSPGKFALSQHQSGKLFVTNAVGLGVFLSAASISMYFFPLYLGYAINTGLHLYERGLSPVLHDVKAFFDKVV